MTRASVEIDRGKAALRSRAAGHWEIVAPAELEQYREQINAAVLRRDRGAHERPAYYAIADTGEFDFESETKATKLRSILHYDAAGVPDGFVNYVWGGWDDHKLDVRAWQAATPEADVGLLEALLSIDLVEKITVSSARVSLLKNAVVNPRSVRCTHLGDNVWLRILDAEQALSQRGWDRDGELVLRIDDAQGFAAGTFRVVASDGAASVTRVEASPDVAMSVETLGQLYFGPSQSPILARASPAHPTA